MNSLTRFALIASLSFYQLLANATPTVQQAAAHLVDLRGIGNNLRSMSLELATKTMTYSMIVYKVGPVAARISIEHEIDVLIPNYQTHWNYNLSVIYARHLPMEALVSIASEGRESKYVGNLSEKLNAIGGDMKAQSMPTLIEMVSAALERTFAKVTESN